MIKDILGRIYALWVAIIFITTMLLVLIPLWLTNGQPEPKRTASMATIYRHWMSVFFFLVGVRLKIYGRKNFAPGENYIVVSNHNSLMDVPLTTARIPGPNMTIAKSEMGKIPIFGIIYRRGSILVDRKDPNSRRDSFLKMRQVLELGMHMVIYPEGTRNKTNKPLKEFHDGAFRLATDSRKPILPVIIYGTTKMLPSDKSFYFWPGKLEMHFLPPLRVTDTDTSDDLKKKVFETMWQYYEEHDPEAAGSRSKQPGL
ncbi:lysophospholipid acyltransferase family protein [Pollutibacter soli]|uniref:lysophospholipid acyltransferase family protein n=1 Tax=Pollutibacter soli TaxID=3034157 RepID=UPI0030137D2D